MEQVVERAKAMFWYIREDFDVTLAEGHECVGPGRKPGQSDNYWWFPSQGYSVAVGVTAFPAEQEKEALHQALIRITAQEERLAVVKAKLIARLTY